MSPPTRKSTTRGTLQTRLYYKPYEPSSTSTQNSTMTSIPKKKLLGYFYDVQPQWEGSSYSYVRPDNNSNNNSTENNNNLRLARHHQEFEFSFGRVAMEQRPERVGADGKTTTGLALWSSALALSSFLDKRFTGSWPTGFTCLELGAGLGLPSIVLARHGVKVLATDKDPETLDLLKQNAKDNLNNNNHTLQVQELDWAQFDDSVLAPDLILASDVVYNGTRPYWRDLLSLLNRLRENRRRQWQEGMVSLPCGNIDTSTDPLVLMGYTQRRLDMTQEQEGEFYALLSRYGMKVTTLPPDLAPYSDHWPLTVLWKLEWVE